MSTETRIYTGTWSRGLDGIRAGPKDLETKLIGLLPDSHYKVRVIAQNAFGNSQASVDYMFKTDMEGKCVYYFRVVHVLDMLESSSE